MGFFRRLFAKKPSHVDPRLAELLANPPRLTSEAPPYPHAPIVLARTVTSAQIEAALERAGFARADEARWTRGATTVGHRTGNGVTLLEFSGEEVLAAQRILLGALSWIDPLGGFYDAMRSPRTPLAELRHLVSALRHYKCAGGVPLEVRNNPDPEIQETVRLIERDRVAEMARAQRARKKG